MPTKPKLFILSGIWLSIHSLIMISNIIKLADKSIDTASLNGVSGISLFVNLGILISVILLIIITINYFRMKPAIVKFVRVYLIIATILGTINFIIYFLSNSVRLTAFLIPIIGAVPNILTVFYLFKNEIIVKAKEIEEYRLQKKKMTL